MAAPLVLDIPFIPDPAYAVFLSKNVDSIGAMHFSLGLEPVPDARRRVRAYSLDELVGCLQTIDGPTKLGLLNARFHPQELYADPAPLVAAIEQLHGAGQLHGLVYADGYLLRALGQAAPRLASALQAIPSVNAMLDAPEKLDAHLRLIEAAGFAPPAKLVPDRGLNRDFESQERFTAHADKRLPGVRMFLLANEGCLLQCPFKLTHDALMADCPEAHFPMARDLGCVKLFYESPELLFSSPFIRPEDAHHYTRLDYGLKLCGRTRGVSVMSKIIDAYLSGSFVGNMLELLDTQEALAHALYVENSALPHDFAKHVAQCRRRCAECGYCRDIEQQLLSRAGAAKGLTQL